MATIKSHMPLSMYHALHRSNNDWTATVVPLGPPLFSRSFKPSARTPRSTYMSLTHSLTHCTFGDASKLHGVKAQLGPSKHYVNHRQPWLYGTQGPRRRYTERRTVGKVTQRPWIQRTRQMHHCKRLTRYRTQNCQLLAQNSVTVPTAALTQLRGLSSPPATPHVVVDTESLLKSRFDNSAFARRVRRRVRRA